MATFIGLQAAGHHEENTSRAVAPESSAVVGLVKPGTGKSVLHGSIAGVFSEDELVSDDAPGGIGCLRLSKSMDREWRDLLVAQASKNHLLRASSWGFVTGANVAGTDTEYGLVAGESLDETFLRDLRTLVAKKRREVRMQEQGPSEEEAASATLRAALIANYANLSQQQLPAETDFWVTMAQAAAAPICVHPPGDASDSIVDFGTGSAAFSREDDNALGNHAPPSAPWTSFVPDYSGPMAGEATSGSFPAPTIPHPSTGVRYSGDYVFSPSATPREQHYRSGASPGGEAKPADAIAPSTAATLKISSEGGSGGGSTTSVARAAMVASQSSGSSESQPSVVSLAAVPVQPNYVYVANYGANTVNEYDLSTGAIVSGFTPISLSNVAAVTLSNNILYVGTFTGSGTIGTYNAVSGAAINANLVTGINQMEGMVVSGNAIYVTSYGSGVLAYNATTGAALAGFSAASVSGPRGIAISGNRLYVVSTNTDTVVVLNATTGALISTFNFGANVAQASSIAVVGNTMYIDDQYYNRIGTYDATTGAAINPQFISESGIVFSMSIYGNDLYVANYSTSKLDIFDLTTGLADSSQTAPSGLNHPFSAAVIPEPGSGVLLATGLITFLGRRRRR